MRIQDCICEDAPRIEAIRLKYYEGTITFSEMNRAIAEVACEREQKMFEYANTIVDEEVSLAVSDDIPDDMLEWWSHFAE